MGDTIERLKGDDFQEAMDTMGEAFGFAPHRDFPMLLPQIYRPTDELMQAIYAIRRDGRIVSAVGVHPREWQVGDTTLKLGGIGGVCTLDAYRGQGLMKALMDRAVADMKAEGFHLSWLGGQRQRYQYYGFEKCGNVIEYTLGPANFRHAGLEKQDLKFEPMGEYYSDRVAVARGFHEAKPMHVNRSQEDFVLYLLSGHCEPWFALDADGNVVGYLVTTAGRNSIREIAAESTATAVQIIVDWSHHIDERVTVTVQPDDVPLSREMNGMAESVRVGGSGNWQIFDWETTLDALMKVNCETRGLMAGEVRLGIGDEVFRLGVDKDGASCARDSGKLDWSLTPFEAHRVLFGPGQVTDVAAVPEPARILEAWTPLPLGFMRGDSV